MLLRSFRIVVLLVSLVTFATVVLAAEDEKYNFFNSEVLATKDGNFRIQLFCSDPNLLNNACRIILKQVSLLALEDMESLEARITKSNSAQFLKLKIESCSPYSAESDIFSKSKVKDFYESLTVALCTSRNKTDFQKKLPEFKKKAAGLCFITKIETEANYKVKQFPMIEVVLKDDESNCQYSIRANLQNKNKLKLTRVCAQAKEQFEFKKIYLKPKCEMEI